MKLSPARVYFIFFAIIDLVTIIYDFSHYLSDFSDHISYFTILSNIFTTILFFYIGFRKNTKKSLINIDSFRGADVLYMSITGIIYNFILAATSTNDLPVVNFVYHQLMPIVVLLSWFLFPPKKHLKFIETFFWLLFPFFYLVYTLIRGALINWYPYFFTDPSKNGGYIGVFKFSLEVLVASLIGAYILTVSVRWLHPSVTKN